MELNFRDYNFKKFGAPILGTFSILPVLFPKNIPQDPPSFEIPVQTRMITNAAVSGAASSVFSGDTSNM